LIVVACGSQQKKTIVVALDARENDKMKISSYAMFAPSQKEEEKNKNCTLQLGESGFCLHLKATWDYKKE
jgi:ribosomal protein L30E